MITITSEVQEILPAKYPHQRGWITLQLDEAETEAVYIGVGDPLVTVNTGLMLKPGAAMTIENDVVSKPAASAIFARTATGTAQLRVNEGI